MQKIKRNYERRRGGWRLFLKSMLITFLCIIFIALGFFAASYISNLKI